MNINSGYGRGIADRLAPFAPTGRTFIVGSSSVIGFNDVQRVFRPDTFGKIRYFSTLAAAVAAATAARGDVIYVLPGHAENVSSATALNLSVSGLTVIGLGNGALRPTFTLGTATTAVVTVSGAGTTVQNIIFDGTGFDAIVKMVNVTAANVTFLACEFILANATNQAVLGILTATVDRLTVQGCAFRGTSDAGCTAAISIVGGNDHLIDGNYIEGAFTAGVGGIQNVTTAMLRARITNNLVNNLTASSTKAIVAVSTSTGFISNNRLQILSGTAPITAAAMSWVGGNYYAATIATAGTLI